MIRRLFTLAMLVAVQTLTALGCGQTRPATYAVALAACSGLSTEAAARACCVDAARSFGRDPSYCLVPVDAGVTEVPPNPYPVSDGSADLVARVLDPDASTADALKALEPARALETLDRNIQDASHE